MTVFDHGLMQRLLHRDYRTRIADSNPVADERARRSIERAEEGFDEAWDRVEEAGEVRRAHIFIRQRNHLGPALLESARRRGQE